MLMVQSIRPLVRNPIAFQGQAASLQAEAGVIKNQRQLRQELSTIRSIYSPNEDLRALMVEQSKKVLAIIQYLHDHPQQPQYTQLKIEGRKTTLIFPSIRKTIIVLVPELTQPGELTVVDNKGYQIYNTTTLLSAATNYERDLGEEDVRRIRAQTHLARELAVKWARNHSH